MDLQGVGSKVSEEIDKINAAVVASGHPPRLQPKSKEEISSRIALGMAAIIGDEHDLRGFGLLTPMQMEKDTVPDVYQIGTVLGVSDEREIRIAHATQIVRELYERFVREGKPGAILYFKTRGNRGAWEQIIQTSGIRGSWVRFDQLRTQYAAACRGCVCLEHMDMQEESCMLRDKECTAFMAIHE